MFVLQLKKWGSLSILEGYHNHNADCQCIMKRFPIASLATDYNCNIGQLLKIEKVNKGLKKKKIKSFYFFIHNCNNVRFIHVFLFPFLLILQATGIKKSTIDVNIVCPLICLLKLFSKSVLLIYTPISSVLRVLASSQPFWHSVIF